MQAWKKMDLSSKTSSIHYFWASSTSFVSRFHSEWFYDEKKPLFLKARVHYVRDTRFVSRAKFYGLLLEIEKIKIIPQPVAKFNKNG